MKIPQSYCCLAHTAGLFDVTFPHIYTHTHSFGWFLSASIVKNEIFEGKDIEAKVTTRMIWWNET